MCIKIKCKHIKDDGTECGHKNSIFASFCGDCGAPLPRKQILLIRLMVLFLALLLVGTGLWFYYAHDDNSSEPTQVRITVSSLNPEFGYVRGDGSYPQADTITIEALANKGYRFVEWNDGNTDSVRKVVADSDKEYFALFDECHSSDNESGEDEDYENPNLPTPKVPKFTIIAEPSNPDKGTVTGRGTYDSLTSVTIKAIPNEGYQFVKWDDGNKDKTREVVADRNKKYVAIFEAELKGEDPNPLPKESTKEYGFGTYSGPLENGIPGPGKGTMYYNCHIQIAKHDTDNPPHYAEEGDYFEGYWYNGDIEFGTLFDKNGKKKESILASKRVVPYNLNNDKCE